ncbi:flagellar hook-basal body complex protein FliE [Niallia nealsonii]|uniref:Flagellar hook-basal body complex protein FliE n=1 Tax=Niallia nealsonii TaxID=115979 RepID=A0A2N0Z6Q3_9BACI|nr:flagellar hook-basal body complex protein FliE [Niallia nealsonii]PKG25173.1 flagellar hook-basal body complex protein FliE [Niallia nealsonii]
MASINFPAVSNVLPTTNANAAAVSTTASDKSKSFATFLKDSLNKVNQAQNESDSLTTKLAKGENIDLSQVMIASQKASITMQATIEIRNKAVEAYQEMMRMTV